MKISAMIEVLQACERGEKIEFSMKGCSGWLPNVDDHWDFGSYDFRIAPKKEMTLVEELRREIKPFEVSLFSRAADRIEELEQIKPHLSSYTTDELLAEIKRRTSC